MEDGGFALAGYTTSFGDGSADIWLVRTDDEGEVIWSQTYGGDGWDDCYSAIRTSEGGFALAGATNTGLDSGFNMYFVVTNEDGDVIISESYSELEWNGCYSVFQTADSGFILAGSTRESVLGPTDILLIKVNENGEEQWTQTFGGDGLDRCDTVIQTDDGGFLLGGYSESPDGDRGQGWVSKTDENGEEVWDNTVGGSSGKTSILQIENEEYLIARYTGTFHERSAGFLLTMADSDGDTLWTEKYQRLGRLTCTSLIKTQDNGFAIAGDRYLGIQEDIFLFIDLVRSDSDGNEQWSGSYGDENQNVCLSLCQSNDGRYGLAGIGRDSIDAQKDFLLIVTEPDPTIVKSDNKRQLTQDYFILSAFPNPFNSTTNIYYRLPNPSNIKFKVFDSSGRQLFVLFDGVKAAGLHSIPIEISGLHSGSYFVSLQSGSQSQAHEITLLK